jgi:hypothetical protein
MILDLVVLPLEPNRLKGNSNDTATRYGIKRFSKYHFRFRIFRIPNDKKFATPKVF